VVLTIVEGGEASNGDVDATHMDVREKLSAAGLAFDVGSIP
jgi:hypothetical protein